MLTIGQMARIFQITPKTLRHYDATDLFSPKRIGEDNSYRYYASEQVLQLKQILFLRSMGVGLEVIKELTRSGALNDPAKVEMILNEQAEAIRGEIEKKQELLYQVQNMLETMKNQGGIQMKPTIVSLQPFTVVGMLWSSANGTGTISEMWDRFIPREEEIQHKVSPTISYGICCPEEKGELEYIAGFEAVPRDLPSGMVSRVVPAQTYAVFTHKGSVSNIGKTMERIYGEWLPQNSLKAAKGIDFELYGDRFYGPHNEVSEVDLYIPIEQEGA
jgi:predicted transcriptional regulator YdeE/DNA-binding transcriptional MerR regulator